MPNPLVAKYGETIQRKSYSPGGINPATGRYEPGVEVLEDIQGAVLPVSEQQMITEVTAAGLETKDAKVFYTDVPLNVSNETTKSQPDILIWRGQEYKVFSSVHRYQIPSLSHYRSIAILNNT